MRHLLHNLRKRWIGRWNWIDQQIATPQPQPLDVLTPKTPLDVAEENHEVLEPNHPGIERC